ncbi:MAG: HPF/RaiA family ribosome-associated protein [Collimonas sp.]|uniref:HPF/RaiA family ribosome-associated protein n=1 Tax=Collimonas sp. TaxID=1963772 RepID=UPI0032664025
MKPTIVAKGIKLSRRLREHVSRRLALAFDRKQYGIHSVTVRISDQNGPRGGVDKHCQIHLVLPGMRPVVVTEKGRDIATMIDQAAYRATQAIDRLLSRAKTVAHTKYALPPSETSLI